MANQDLFCLMENIKDEDYVIATYSLELDSNESILKKASAFAVGQTLGTWTPVPGIDDEMRRKHMGKLINIYDIPAEDLDYEARNEKKRYLIQLAFPTVNFGAQFPMMMTTLTGNDASTSISTKLVDLQLPRSFVAGFAGPKFGIAGIRKLLNIPSRPLLLNMIKPCTGITPEVGGRIFYETALGGVDLIKDDELLGNPEFSSVANRVKAYKKAARQAYEETGHKTLYVVNVTDQIANIAANAKTAVELGADAVMVNYAAVGFDVLSYIAKTVAVPVLGHYAGAGVFYESGSTGISSHLIVGKFPRLAGADMVIINTPYGNYPLRHQKYISTAHHLTLPLYDLKPAFPAVGGGVHPGMVDRFVADLGSDIILASGGAVQGHPQGAAAGAKAMRQAIDAAHGGLSVEEAAGQHEELKCALTLWGYQKP
ncbi:MAG: RuBisCO large subunit C-terminal-like domain-containing protein [Negativicutes bacterium]|nr:RuBisCO large subunit C-terminal-like domain-containing protein [Negativicutes bacterium]